MKCTPGTWKLGTTPDSIVTTPTNETPKLEILHYGGKVIAESISNDADRKLIASAPEMRKSLDQLAEIIARNLTAWDTSKDKTQGLLPEVYWSNGVWYERLTGEEYSFSKAVKKFNIE